MIACSYNNNRTVRNMGRGKEVVRFLKERITNTAKVTQADQSNHWRGMREYKVMKQQQQGLAVPN